MNKEFVPYEEALALKELGFDEPVMFTYYRKKLGYIKNSIKSGEMPNLPYPKYVLAPLYQQAFRWFREKYGMKFYIKQDNWNHWCIPMIHIPETNNHEDICGSYETYEEAELACLRKLIEIIN